MFVIFSDLLEVLQTIPNTNKRDHEKTMGMVASIDHRCFVELIYNVLIDG